MSLHLIFTNPQPQAGQVMSSSQVVVFEFGLSVGCCPFDAETIDKAFGLSNEVGVDDVEDGFDEVFRFAFTLIHLYLHGLGADRLSAFLSERHGSA